MEQPPQTRMTLQRKVILEELCKMTTHPTADELYNVVRARLPRISLGTIYRNLDFLTESGQILCLEVSGSTKRFEGNITPHQHVRCVHCGRIADVYPSRPVPDTDGMRVPGFASVHAARIEYEGVCEHCANSRAAAPRRLS